MKPFWRLDVDTASVGSPIDVPNFLLALDNFEISQNVSEHTQRTILAQGRILAAYYELHKDCQR